MVGSDMWDSIMVTVNQVRLSHRWRYTTWACLGVLLMLLCSCSEPAHVSEPAVRAAGDQTVEPKPTVVESVPPTLPALNDPSRWLFVQKVEKDGDGGWATGAFDPNRNKITIETHAVKAFRIDTSRMKINWKKLVILSIDGRNSELKKRDWQVLYFALNRHGLWVVEETGK